MPDNPTLDGAYCRSCGALFMPPDQGMTECPTCVRKKNDIEQGMTEWMASEAGQRCLDGVKSGVITCTVNNLENRLERSFLAGANWAIEWAKGNIL